MGTIEHIVTAIFLFCLIAVSPAIVRTIMLLRQSWEMTQPVARELKKCTDKLKESLGKGSG